MTRGRCGSLFLHRVTLSFTTPRRFNPAHGGRDMSPSRTVRQALAVFGLAVGIGLGAAGGVLVPPPVPVALAPTPVVVAPPPLGGAPGPYRFHRYPRLGGVR